MNRLCTVWAAFASLIAAAAALGATGEEIYRGRCRLCHDSGAGMAPRISDKAAWAPRVTRGKEALYQSALKGVPDTAMMPKGGHLDLSDDEVRAAVDYMLLQVGYDRLAPSDQASKDRVARGAAALASGSLEAAMTRPSRAPPIDDQALTGSVAEALRKAQDISPPDAKVENQDGITTVRGAGIKVETHD